jgi:hypothetical protein
MGLRICAYLGGNNLKNLDWKFRTNFKNIFEANVFISHLNRRFIMSRKHKSIAYTLAGFKSKSSVPGADAMRHFKNINNYHPSYILV